MWERQVYFPMLQVVHMHIWGLHLYESIVPGMPGYQSIASQLNGKLALPVIQQGKKYHWPASANAALAFILKNLLPHTTLRC